MKKRFENPLDKIKVNFHELNKYTEEYTDLLNKQSRSEYLTDMPIFIIGLISFITFRNNFVIASITVGFLIGIFHATLKNYLKRKKECREKKVESLYCDIYSNILLKTISIERPELISKFDYVRIAKIKTFKGRFEAIFNILKAESNNNSDIPKIYNTIFENLSTR